LLHVVTPQGTQKGKDRCKMIPSFARHFLKPQPPFHILVLFLIDGDIAQTIKLQLE
jgi:hypothetical protein